MAKHGTREAWLRDAAEKLRPIFKAALEDLDLPRKVKYPEKKDIYIGVVPLTKKAVGTYWDNNKSENKQAHPIGICASLKDPTEVLATLTHELTHACVGVKEKHNKTFAALARRVGLEGRMTSTSAGEALAIQLGGIAEKLGPYPHVAWTKTLVDRKPDPAKRRLVNLKSETPGMEKYRCTVRGEHLETYGFPKDPAGKPMVPVRG